MKSRPVSLSRRMLTQFVVCTVALLLLATPLFYLLTKHYYAEDLIDIIEAVKSGKPIPALDLEADIMHGIMLQFVLITGIVGIAIVLTVRFILRRLWKPFDDTLKEIEGFRLEDGRLPALPESDIKEFIRLNHTLEILMKNNLTSYRSQKEFTENASHELQTPLAVFQSKLDLLLQLPDLTERQAEIIQNLYQVSGRLSRLNRNLLLLAKIENNQYARMEETDVVELMEELLPSLETLAGSIAIECYFKIKTLAVRSNRTLLESLVSNLVINAVRHNRAGGTIRLTLDEHCFMIANTSDEQALNPEKIFNRFYRPSEKTKGNGLGLAIVKAICEFHGWNIDYTYREGKHIFTVIF